MMSRSRKYTYITSGMECPHCRTALLVRQSVGVTRIVRELRLNCNNDDCGATFVAQLSLVLQIRPSEHPNPAVTLPRGEWRSRPPANDDAPVPANDDVLPAAESLPAPS